MLQKSKNKNEKIVLGLLSYTEGEDAGLSDYKELLEDYQNDDSKEIYLYRESEKDNVIGLIGIQLQGEKQGLEDSDTNQVVMIRHFSIIPSFRNEGLAYKMFCELKELYPHAAIIGTLNTVDLIAKLAQKYEEEYE